MALAGSHILPRDSDSGSNGTLTTGAIAGIACGAGALFLGAAGLFIVYWRRQRQFDREDEYYENHFEGRGPPGSTAPAVTYTMDYKMDDPQHNEGDHGSSYTYSPEKASYPFSPLSALESASAMPTHPAYIPRALVRGRTTPSNRSVATASPPPFPTPAFSSASTSNSKTQPDDAMIQAYLNAATAAQPQPQPSPPPQAGDAPTESDSSFSGGLPLQSYPPRTHSAPTTVPAMVFPSISSPPHSASSTTDSARASGSGRTSHGRPPPARRPPPPPLKNLSTSPGAKPLSGRENATISGPLAFPQHYHHPGYQPGSGSGSGWIREDDTSDAAAAQGQSQSQSQSESGGRMRSFRARAFSSPRGGGGGGGGEREAKKKEKKEKKKKQRNSGGHRFYAEVEIGNGSDIW